MALANINEVSGGDVTFFNPKDHSNDLAIILEPKSIRKDVPNTYEGVTKPRDEVKCRLTIFRNQEELDNGTPQVYDNAVVHHKALASTAEALLEQGAGSVVVVRKAPGKKYYSFQAPAPQHGEAAAAYYAQREAAEAEVAASAPSFD